jgi:hypothetical protein
MRKNRPADNGSKSAEHWSAKSRPVQSPRPVHSFPRGRRISARNEEIEIDVMAKAAQLYALMVLDICRSRKRPPPA